MENKSIFDTHVQGIKYKAVREIIRAYDEDRLSTAYLDIPKIALPGPKGTLRCCVYKERAIFQERMRIVQSGVSDKDKCIVEVIDIACDECPVDGMLVTTACRGCLSHRCQEVCPKDAIKIVDKHSVIDKEKCVECGKCVSACPYGAIVKQQRPCVSGCKVKAVSVGASDKKAKIDESKCVNCGICVRQCPFGAIQEKSMILECLDILKNGQNGADYNTYAVIAPSFVSQFQYASSGQIIAAVMKLGFTRVVEAAFGADVCLSHELKQWSDKGILTTSCCPSFVSYVRKNFPESADKIASSLSPMMETARALKAADKNCRTVFIGPCAAKKAECKDTSNGGLIDSAISFEELQAFFDARNINAAELTPVELDDASKSGTMFARSGGISHGIKELAENAGIENLRPVALSGLEDCRINMFKLRANKTQDNFFEGMACEGGCVNGPLCLRQSLSGAAAVDRHANDSSKNISDSVSQYDGALNGDKAAAAVAQKN